MRIGELAALVGVTTRTVRHYHRLGLLPEPERLSNGYREYRLRDAVVLARVRRLAELGLTLDEIRDVLADERGRDLREVLEELDADLARQQEAIARRRERLGVLLAEADLHPDLTVSPDRAEILRGVAVADSPTAELDRQLLTLLDARAGADLMAVFRPLAEPGVQEQTRLLYARLDALADARPDDPRVAGLAAELATLLPAELLAALGDSVGDEESRQWLEVLARELSPAQLQVFLVLADDVRRSS